MLLRVFLLFFMLSFYSFSQTYEIGYKEYFSLLGGGIEAIKEEIKNKQAHGKPDMILQYCNGESLYRKFVEDKEIFQKREVTESKIKSYLINLPSTYKNYKTRILKKSYPNFVPQLYGEDILVKDSIPFFDWELTDITQTISGYKCTLAKTIHYDGAKILAWYTDEIPLNEGPREYWGLPGLILQVQVDDRVLIVATSITQTDTNTNIEEPMNGEVMTIKGFEAFKKELYRPRTITTPDGREIIVSDGKH